MSEDKKKDGLDNAPDMSGAWRVIGTTVGAFVALMGMSAAMKKSHDRKKDKDSHKPQGPNGLD